MFVIQTPELRIQSTVKEQKNANLCLGLHLLQLAQSSEGSLLARAVNSEGFLSPGEEGETFVLSETAHFIHVVSKCINSNKANKNILSFVYQVKITWKGMFSGIVSKNPICVYIQKED